MQKQQQVSVILPCAGTGSRLGLNSPKELFELWEDFPLIRFSLEHIKYAISNESIELRVVVVIREGKESIVHYVQRFLGKKASVHIVYADPSFKEWPGSIYSARSYFCDYNIVLLPDSWVSLSSQSWRQNASMQGLLESCLVRMEHSYLVLGRIDVDDVDVLTHFGAIRSDEEGQVWECCDKPSHPNIFNGFWGCLAFSKEIAHDLHLFLSRSVQKIEVNFSEFCFCPAQSFKMHDYVDLGKWESIEVFRKRYSGQQQLGLD